MDKKNKQLGMNPSTASGRLVKDLLFKFIIESGHKCFRCGKELTREDFSIDHKVPWLDSDNPLGLYFDLENIAFSHHVCNRGDARKPARKPEVHGTIHRYTCGCRCDACKKAKSEDNKKRKR